MGDIAFLSGVAAWLGYRVFGGFSAEVVAGMTAVAAGAILAMLADTMIPEAFEGTRDYTGLVTVVGFLLAFTLSKVEGQGGARAGHAGRLWGTSTTHPRGPD